MCVDDISFKHRRRYPGRYDYSLHSFKAIQLFSVSWIGMSTGITFCSWYTLASTVFFIDLKTFMMKGVDKIKHVFVQL